MCVNVVCFDYQTNRYITTARYVTTEENRFMYCCVFMKYFSSALKRKVSDSVVIIEDENLEMEVEHQNSQPKESEDESEDEEMKAAKEASILSLSAAEQLFERMKPSLKKDIELVDAACAEIRFNPCFIRRGSHVVKQLTVLSQRLSCLRGRYGDHFHRLCGFYAAHNAMIFYANNEKTEVELERLTNDRKVLDKLIPPDSNHLSPEEIYELLPQAHRDEIFIESLHLPDNADLPTRIEEFCNFERKCVVCILPTNNFDHYLALMIRRNADARVETIIADSLGQSRLGDEELLETLSVIENAIADAETKVNFPLS